MQRVRSLKPSSNVITKASLLFLAFAMAVAAQTAKAQQYQVTFLDDLGGNSRGNSVNDRSWIAGFSLFAGNAKRHAVLWRGGSILDLGTLGGPDRNSNVAWPVKNNIGIISGISQTNTPEPNGERWSCSAFFGGQSGYTCLGFVWVNNAMRALAPLPGGNNSFATGSNNTGRVVGWAENGVHDPTCVAPQVLQFRPVTWGPAINHVQELPLIAGDTSGAATAINNRGQIVGISGICDQAVGRYTAKHAVLWDDDKVIDLGNIGAELWITPMAINQQGVVVGFGATQSNDLDGDFLRAFIWTGTGGIQRIDPLPGHVFSQANGVNERGQVVGSSCDVSGACQGFLWQNNVLKNLNDLIAPGFNGVIINAQDINDRGQITGRAFNSATGKITAFVAVPVDDDDSVRNSTPPTKRAAIALPLNVKQALRQQRGMASLLE